MNVFYLRRARKICQLDIRNVCRMSGLEFDVIHQAEMTNDYMDKQTVDVLWKLYEENEKPSRFEGKLQTIGELKEAYYSQVEAVTP